MLSLYTPDLPSLTHWDVNSSTQNETQTVVKMDISFDLPSVFNLASNINQTFLQRGYTLKELYFSWNCHTHSKQVTD